MLYRSETWTLIREVYVQTEKPSGKDIKINPDLGRFPSSIAREIMNAKVNVQVQTKKDLRQPSGRPRDIW